MADKAPLTVAVDGATGYLGNHLIATLRTSGFNVRAIVHPGARKQDLEFLQSTGATIYVASLKQTKTPQAALAKALTGADVAVHLIGSIAPRKGEKLQDLHVSQTAHWVKTAKECGVKKLVQVTALGTSVQARNKYHSTKGQAEEVVRKSGLPWIILRPSLIVGKQVGNRDSKLVARYLQLIAKRRSVPVIGDGRNRLQPVFIGDLVTALERCIADSRFDNEVYEIGGDEILSMRQLVEKLMLVTGVKKRITGVKPLAAGLLAALCETVQSVPTVSRDQVKLSMSDNICTQNALRKTFGIAPTSIDRALESYQAQSPSGGMLEGTGHGR